MDGYTVAEAASVLGVPTERVWELLARGVLSGTPEGESGMRVYLKPRPGPLSAPPPRTNGNGGTDGGRELSPFRELLNEFRSLTERYGQALLALGEARGEVAALRSRVDALEARIELRLPGPFGPSAPMPATQAPMRPADEAEAASTFVAPPSHVQPDEEAAPAPVDAAESPEPVPAPPVEVAETEPAAPAEHAEETDDRHQRRRRAWAGRVDTSAIADALARAEDPSTADLPGGREAAEAMAAFRATAEPPPAAAAVEHEAEREDEAEAPAEPASAWAASAPVIDVEEDVVGRVEPAPVELPDQQPEPVSAPPEPEAMAEPELVREPEAVVETAAEAEPLADAQVEPEVVAEAVAEPDAAAAAPAEPEPEFAAGPELVAEPEVVAEPEPEAVAEAPAGVEPEVLAEAPAEVVAGPEPEVVAEPEPELEVVAEPEPEPELVAEPEPEFAAEPEAVGEPGPDVEPAEEALTQTVEEPSVAPEGEPPWMEDRAAYASGTGEPDWISEEDLAPTPSAPQPGVETAASEPAAPEPSEPASSRSHPDEEEVLWLGDEWDDEMESAPPGSPSPWASHADPAEPTRSAEIEWPNADRDLEPGRSASAAPQPGRLPGGRELDEALAALEALGGPADEQVEQEAAATEPSDAAGERGAPPAGGPQSSGPASRAYHRLRRILPH